MFFRAVLLGLSVAAPVGPIGILCIRRTLSGGRRLGLACGLGAATADALYGLLAGLGVSAVSSLLVAHQAPVRGVGALYLGYLGYCTLRSPPAREAAALEAASVLKAWSSTFLLTLTNPMTLLSFAAMFSALGLGTRGGLFDVGVLVSGVFLGSAAWWLLLSAFVAALRSSLKPVHLRLINLGSGLMLLGFAVLTLAALGRGARGL